VSAAAANAHVGDLSQFTDQPSQWAISDVRWAVGSGLLQGKGAGLLDARGDTTRAELAAVLHRFLG